MGIRFKILSLIIIVMMMVPLLGININTHICGQTKDVSKSIIIPGILNPKECKNCHYEVVIIKSCCSNKKKEAASIKDKNPKDNNCCKDLKEYNGYKYLNVRINKIILDYSDNILTLNSTVLLFITQESSNKKFSDNYGRRPYVVDILSFICAYLI
jgi:hypothetical protein